jgi:hypothetical protein
MDMMNQVYGELIGGWIGKFIEVEVDEEGMAWGKDLRIRVAIRVDQPLLRGVPLKDSDSDEEGRWFDIKYEKVPHFCFDCGCLVHPADGCQGSKEETKQWGEWLRASPRRNARPPAPARPAVSSSSFSSRSEEADSRFRGNGGVSIRDIPPRRNLVTDFTSSSTSRTGGMETRRGAGEVSSLDRRRGDLNADFMRDSDRGGAGSRIDRGGTFVRRPRQVRDQATENVPVPLGTKNKNRTTKQV